MISTFLVNVLDGLPYLINTFNGTLTVPNTSKLSESQISIVADFLYRYWQKSFYLGVCEIIQLNMLEWVAGRRWFHLEFEEGFLEFFIGVVEEGLAHEQEWVLVL